MLKNVMDVSTSLVIWWLCGSAIMGEGGNAFAGAIFTTLDGDEQQGLFTSRWLLGYMYVAASVTIVSGAIAERTRHPGYIFSSSLTALCIYPVIAHWVWASNGMFSRQNPKALLGGAIDFAGGGVVHVTGGTLALCASKLVGPRNGRFDSLTHQPLEMRGQSTSYIMIGTFFLWVGWLAFNMGSTLGISTRGAAQTAARVGSRTMLAGSAGHRYDRHQLRAHTLLERLEELLRHPLGSRGHNCLLLNSGSLGGRRHRCCRCLPLPGDLAHRAL